MIAPKHIHLAIFASGGGSNAKNILAYFSSHPHIHVKLLCTNNPKSGVVNMGKDNALPVSILSREEYGDGDFLVDLMGQHQIHLIILAGYLKKIPDSFIQSFPQKIINIHPSLLPDFGGKGMYGMNVHKAVIATQKKESGISIHYVNEEYDKGKMIFQQSLKVKPGMNAKELQTEILKLEHKHYPEVIEKICQGIHS